MRIEVSGAVLRRLEPADVEQLYVYRNDPAVVSSLGGFSTGYTKRDLEDWLEFHRGQRNEVLLCIADPDTDKCLGHVGLYNIDYRVRKAELAILIGATTHHGRGLGTSACGALIDYAHQQLNLRRVELTLLATNEPAMRLYERLGFVEEGRLVDAEYRDGRYVDVICMAHITAR
ncbi:MAG: GNAT family protein [Pseudomonadota bacterium]